MNIFVLDTNPEIAAQMLMDKHVVKMALETAQLLSTLNGGPYKPTHINHPCNIWIAQARDNYDWLVNHGMAICKEYTYRYGKEHKCESVIESLRFPNKVLKTGFTDFMQCMPIEFKQKDPVQAYRAYYHSKRSFASWTKRNKPEWWQDVQSTREVSIDPRTIRI